MPQSRNTSFRKYIVPEEDKIQALCLAIFNLPTILEICLWRSFDYFHTKFLKLLLFSAFTEIYSWTPLLQEVARYCFWNLLSNTPESWKQLHKCCHASESKSNESMIRSWRLLSFNFHTQSQTLCITISWCALIYKFSAMFKPPSSEIFLLTHWTSWEF